MRKAGATNVTITKGWFEQTLPVFQADGGIGILRLDGDWYESTMTCLTHLFPQVNRGGLVIIDDYYAFAGCALAVHDYLSQHKLGFRISQLDNDVCYIVVREEA
jgi:O-methyltransferase